MIKTLLRALSVALFALLAAACTATSEVHELAGVTASNASLVNTRLAAFKRGSEEIAARRLEAIAALSEEVERMQVKSENFLESARSAAILAGKDKKPNYAMVITEVRRLTEALAASERASSQRVADLRAAIKESQSPLNLPSQQLGTIAKNLGALSKEPDRATQLGLLKDFFIQIVKDIDSQKQDADKAVATPPDVPVSED